MEPDVVVDFFGMTDRGKRRETNEDQFLIARLNKVIEVAATSLPDTYQRRFGSAARAHLFVIADGVGGQALGERASSLTLDAVAHYITCGMHCFYGLDEYGETDLTDQLTDSVRRSHERVRAEAEAITGAKGMATTLTMAHVIWPRAYVVHIGDSRCYHLRGSSLRQVTTDHTLAQALVDGGVLDPEAAKTDRRSHVLTQAVGGGDVSISPEVVTVDLEPDDAIVLCTDGLTKHVADEDIARHTAGASSARAACEALVQDALDAGGTDNITVTVGRFSSASHPGSGDAGCR